MVFSGYKLIFVFFVNGCLLGLLCDILMGFLFEDEKFLCGWLVGVVIGLDGWLFLMVDDVGDVIWCVLVV